MKKLLSLAIALVMALSLVLPAAAAETPAAPISPAPAEQTGLRVMLNGSYITFPDVQPELKDGRTMVPFRALAEAMGGTVTFSQDGTVACTLGDTALSFVLGEDTVLVTAGGETRTVQMDVACYYKNGRTMVPVRFFAEALGCNVLWDRYQNCAVILNPQALADAVDAKFTVVNKALARMAADPSKTYQTTLDFTFNMELEYEGRAVPLGLGVHASAVSNSDGMELKGYLDLTDLMNSDLFEELFGTGGFTEADLLVLRQTFSKVEFQVIYNYADGTYYFQMPLLAKLSGGEIDSKSWMKFTLDPEEMDELLEDMGMPSLKELQEESFTLGSYLYTLCYMADYYYNGASIWYDMMSIAEVLEGLVGDESLTKTAAGWRCTVDAARLEQLLGEPEGSAAEVFDKLECTLDLPDSGPVTFKLNILGKADEWGDRVTLTGSGSLSATKMVYDVTLEIGGLGKFQVKLNASSTVTNQKPASAPPSGAAVVDLNDPYGLETPEDPAA